MLLLQIKKGSIILEQQILNKLTNLHVCFFQIICDHEVRNALSFIGEIVPRVENNNKNDSPSLIKETILGHYLCVHSWSVESKKWMQHTLVLML